MGKIIAFPSANQRDWRDMEALFRETYKDIPDGIPTLEECLPTIKKYWADIFVSFSVQPSYQLPGPLSNEQIAAVREAVETTVHLMAERLTSERTRLFGLLVVSEWKAAYFRRNGVVV